MCPRHNRAGVKMGIADRDWYRDEIRRRDPWIAPLNEDFRRSGARRSLHSTLWAVLLVVAMVGSAVAHRWWEGQQRSSLPTTASPTGKIPPADLFADDPTWHQGPRPTQEEHTNAPPTETREVTKCIVNGRATYTGVADCGAGVRVSVPVGRGPSPEELQNAQIQAQNLAQQAAEVDRQAAWRQWRLEQQLANASPPASLAKPAECAALDQAIQGYDAQARQPQSAGTQDWIKDRRAEARSRQFALHC